MKFSWWVYSFHLSVFFFYSLSIKIQIELCESSIDPTKMSWYVSNNNTKRRNILIKCDWVTSDLPTNIVHLNHKQINKKQSERLKWKYILASFNWYCKSVFWNCLFCVFCSFHIVIETISGLVWLMKGIIKIIVNHFFNIFISFPLLWCCYSNKNNWTVHL